MAAPASTPSASPSPRSPWSFDFDRMDADVDAVRVESKAQREELPTHRHCQAQLAIVLRGAMACEVPGALWMAPLHGGLWIPGGVPHSNRMTPNGEVCFLFVQADVPYMPDTCSQLAVTPLLRELVRHLAALPPAQQRSAEAARLRAVLLDQLKLAPTQSLHLPVSDEPRLRSLLDALMERPGDGRTVAQWAAALAMSERTLTRLIQTEIGMPLGRWRQRLHLVIALQRLSMRVSVQQVSAELGYESVSAFIRMFRKALGRSPGHYLAGTVGAVD